MLVYAGLRGESPLEALRGVLTGKPGAVPSGTPVTVSGASGGSLASGTGIVAAGANTAVQVALRQVGQPYRWGGGEPGGFDCSGLISYAYNSAGMKIGRLTSWGFASSPKFRKVRMQEAMPGDVLWHPGHVVMFIGNGQIVEAPHAGAKVRTRSFRPSEFSLALHYVG